LITEIKEGNYDVNLTLDSIVNCKLSELKNNKPVYVYAIITWILNYAKEGEGLGFPFDLPYVSLYERCLKALIIIDRLILLLAELKTVYGSMENIPAVFSQVPYEMFKLEQERFYAERRGRIIKFKRDDSEIFEIIGKGLENMEMQSNGLLTP
jgi:hypothetical protein